MKKCRVSLRSDTISSVKLQTCSQSFRRSDWLSVFRLTFSVIFTFCTVCISSRWLRTCLFFLFFCLDGKRSHKPTDFSVTCLIANNNSVNHAAGLKPLVHSSETLPPRVQRAGRRGDGLRYWFHINRNWFLFLVNLFSESGWTGGSRTSQTKLISGSFEWVFESCCVSWIWSQPLTRCFRSPLDKSSSFCWGIPSLDLSVFVFRNIYFLLNQHVVAKCFKWSSSNCNIKICSKPRRRGGF